MKHLKTRALLAGMCDWLADLCADGTIWFTQQSQKLVPPAKPKSKRGRPKKKDQQ